MPGKSSKTGLVSMRLPLAILEKVKGNAAKRGVSVSEYLAKIVVVQVGRKR